MTPAALFRCAACAPAPGGAEEGGRSRKTLGETRAPTPHIHIPASAMDLKERIRRSPQEDGGALGSSLAAAASPRGRKAAAGAETTTAAASSRASSSSSCSRGAPRRGGAVGSSTTPTPPPGSLTPMICAFFVVLEMMMALQDLRKLSRTNYLVACWFLVLMKNLA